MIGNTASPIVPITEEPVSADSLNSKSAHCHAKHSSATVATVLPTITEESGDVPKAHPLQIYPRKNRSKRAGCNEETGQGELLGSIDVGLPQQPLGSEAPQHDIPNRNGAEQLPPAKRQPVRNHCCRIFTFAEWIDGLVEFSGASRSRIP